MYSYHGDIGLFGDRRDKNVIVIWKNRNVVAAWRDKNVVLITNMTNSEMI